MSGYVRTMLRDGDVVVSDEMHARTFWLLKKYTSLTYIQRMYDLYAPFVGGYEDYISRQDPSPWLRENMIALLRSQASLQDAIRHLQQQGTRLAIKHLWFGLEFSSFLSSRRFDEGCLAHEPLGYRQPPAQPVSLYAWAYRAIRMAGRIQSTLAAQWWFPRIFESDFEQFAYPPELPPLPRFGGPIVVEGGEIPVSGIWKPLDVRSGCLNYFVETAIAPKGLRAKRRVDSPAFPATAFTPAIPPRTDYSEIAVPTRWQLVWEDRRYRDGTVPAEEALYLDAATALPPWPARVLTS